MERLIIDFPNIGLEFLGSKFDTQHTRVNVLFEDKKVLQDIKEKLLVATKENFQSACGALQCIFDNKFAKIESIEVLDKNGYIIEKYFLNDKKENK